MNTQNTNLWKPKNENENFLFNYGIKEFVTSKSVFLWAEAKPQNE